MVFVVRAKSHEEGICLLGTLQLFTHFDAKTQRCWLDQRHMTKDWCCFAAVNYFVMFMSRHLVCLSIVGMSLINNSTWLF